MGPALRSIFRSCYQHSATLPAEIGRNPAGVAPCSVHGGTEMKPWNGLPATLHISLVALLSTGTLHAQHDPGPRAGSRSRWPIPDSKRRRASHIHQWLGSIYGSERLRSTSDGNGGLGPGFNSNGCAFCNSQPIALGTSPSPTSPQKPQSNLEIAAGLSTGATNVIPSFITVDGPVREARPRAGGRRSCRTAVEGI